MVGNIIRFDSNHLKVEAPPLFSKSILEIFDLCFVSSIERPTAAQLLQCSWFQSTPSVQSLLASAAASKEDSLDLESFNYLSGYKPARHATPGEISQVTPRTKKKSRFRVSDKVFNWSSRKRKEQTTNFTN